MVPALGFRVTDTSSISRPFAGIPVFETVELRFLSLLCEPVSTTGLTTIRGRSSIVILVLLLSSGAAVGEEGNRPGYSVVARVGEGRRMDRGAVDVIAA